MLWAMLNWPGSVPGSPQENSRRPSGVYLWTRELPYVGDVEVAPRRHRGVGAAVKRLAAHIRRRLPRHADGQQYLAVESALPNRVVAVIGQPDRLVRRHE